MDARLKTILGEYRRGLEALYGARLRDLILFGSQARGDARSDSDIDVLIVLEGPVNRWDEVCRTSVLTGDLSLKFSTLIQRQFASVGDLGDHNSGFLREIAREGTVM